MLDVAQHQLLPHAVYALAQGADAPSNRRHMQAPAASEALHERGGALPPTRRPHLSPRRLRAEDHTGSHRDQTSLARDLDDLRLEQLRLGPGALGLAALELPPLAVMHDQRSERLAQSIGEKQRGTV